MSHSCSRDIDVDLPLTKPPVQQLTLMANEQSVFTSYLIRYIDSSLSVVIFCLDPRNLALTLRMTFALDIPYRVVFFTDENDPIRFH